MVDLDRPTASASEIIIGFFSMLLSFCAICGIFSIFFLPFSAKSFIVAGAILLTCLLIFGVVALLKCLFVFIHKKCKTSKSRQIRNQILIGLGAIALCGIVPRILVFFVEPNVYFVLSTIFLSWVISIALYYIFVFECDKLYKFGSSEKPFWIIGAVHALVLLITAKIALICDFHDVKKFAIISFQLLFMPICLSSTIEFYGVLSRLRKLEGDEEEEAARKAERIRLESVKVVPKTEEVPRLECEACKNQEPLTVRINPKIDCQICRLEYSEALIPRILNGCGHTICEKCTETLLKKHQGKFLSCPICQKGTVVNGPASLLQKNYGILEIINYLKN